jgi:uroporphyrinogen III methyltransferase/synthase
MVKQGKVYLVGAGPGETGLITVKGLDCLKKADVIIYDRLLDNSLLEMARPEAEKIYVGKAAKHHTLEQSVINQLLVKKAQEGKIVVRLKGGDPFILGRGGEEAEALALNHIHFEIVPGVSSATAVPAYAGIPVTHRGLSSSFTVVTGHEAIDKDKTSLAWDKLSTGSDTLVFLMAMGNLTPVVQRLLKNGRAPSTPVAVISHGTSPNQKTIVGTLETILDRAKSFEPPAVVVVGQVVQLRDCLRWFDNYPLFGKRILVTRARHQTSSLSQLFRECGAMPVEIPAIKIQPLLTPNDLDQAILNIKNYHWIVFTSVNGVEAFFHRLYALKLDARWLGNLRLGAIGPATAKALENKGLWADYIPKTYTSRGFLSGLKNYDLTGCRVLLPRADIANKELAQGIARLGAQVQEVTVYQTIPNTEAISKGKEMLKAGEIDVVTFTSSSTVTNLIAALGKECPVINEAVIACIGPRTAATATKSGLRVDIIAREHTITGLVEAIKQYFQRKRGDND